MAKAKSSNYIKEMKPAAVRRLAMAVFFVFGTFGPITVLMESELRSISWGFVLLQTVAVGGMAASIIIVIYNWRRWWTMLLTIVFWTVFMLFIGGGLSFIFDSQGFRVKFSDMKTRATNTQPLQSRTLTPAELDTIYTQRGIVGLLAIVLISLGYATFLRVIGKEVQDRTRLQTEVKIAQNIQQSLLPSSTFHLPWCEIVGTTVPATEVGGDYFDIIPIGDQQITVVIADVAGHGVGAGIVSAMTKSALYSQLQHDPSPARVLENLNRTIYDVSDDKMFVTLACVLLDNTTHRIHIATAGHPPVLHLQAKTQTISRHRTASLGLGIRPETQFSSVEALIEPEDTLLLYTDGIVEAMNDKGEAFGLERLERVLMSSNGAIEKVCSDIITALRDFCGKEVFQDDVSAVCVKLC